mgnify:FL=1
MSSILGSITNSLEFASMTSKLRILLLYKKKKKNKIPRIELESIRVLFSVVDILYSQGNKLIYF